MSQANRRAFMRMVSYDPRIRIAFEFATFGAQLVHQLPEEALHEIDRIYRRVDGRGQITVPRLEQFAIRLGQDDRLWIARQQFIVEYDEWLHFSTYRARTLRSTLYDRLRVGFSVDGYTTACGRKRMTRGSKRAHNDHSHKHFKCPVEPGECRHKQRAFYDFLKDVLLGFGLKGAPRIIRISDPDFAGGLSPTEVERNGTLAQKRALAKLLRDRARVAIGSHLRSEP